MCRNIRTLSNFQPPATEDEMQAAALQYVRKISGTTKPSRVNEARFAAAVDAVTAATRTLLRELKIQGPPRDRAVEAARAKERSRKRFGDALTSPRESRARAPRAR